MTVVADSLGRIVRMDEPDASGNLGAVDTPAQPTSYEYDGNANLTKVTQSDGTVTQERKFRYDSLSRLTHEKLVEANPTLDNAGIKGTAGPNKWTKVLKYNLDGLLSEGVDARGVKTTFSYDGLNRVAGVAYTGEPGYQTPSVTYTYDQARSGFFNTGALTKVETAAVGDTPATASELDYDLMGRVRKHRQWVAGQQYDIEYTYNLAGQLTSEKYPSGRVVSMTYDANGRPTTVADVTRLYVTGMQYQGKANSVSQMTFGNGTVQNFTLNDRLQMTGQELKRGTDVLQKYDYGYGQIDGAGNLDLTKNNGQLAMVESHIGTNKQWTQKFNYDSINRLKESNEYRGDTNALTYKQTYDFDRFGNMYRKATNNNPTGQDNPLPYTPIEETDISKSTNRFTTNTSYDDAGNVTADDKFREMGFSYDANGRMVKATKTSVPDASSVYDASGTRVAEKVNDVWRFLIYDTSGKMIAEYGGTSSASDGGVKYILSDWQGSTRAVVGNTGHVQSRSDYSAFGEDVGSGTGTRTAQQGFGASDSLRQKYGLTERDDATGLDHTWFRKNENQAGRWTSPDPYDGSMSVGNPQSFNRYSYVENEPTNFVDPSGLFMAPPYIADWSWWDNMWSSWDVGFGGDFGWLYDPPTGGNEVSGDGGSSRDRVPDDKCFIMVVTTAVDSSGRSSRSSSRSSSDQRRPEPGPGGAGIINHLYLTYSDSSTNLEIGVRGGTDGDGYLGGELSLYDRGFTDYQTSRAPVGGVELNKNCDEFQRSVQDTLKKFEEKKVAYSLLGNNSNAFLYTVLARAGIDTAGFTEGINRELGRFGTARGWGTLINLD